MRTTRIIVCAAMVTVAACSTDTPSPPSVTATDVSATASVSATSSSTSSPTAATEIPVITTTSTTTATPGPSLPQGLSGDAWKALGSVPADIEVLFPVVEMEGLMVTLGASTTDPRRTATLVSSDEIDWFAGPAPPTVLGQNVAGIAALGSTVIAIGGEDTDTGARPLAWLLDGTGEWERTSFGAESDSGVACWVGALDTDELVAIGIVYRDGSAGDARRGLLVAWRSSNGMEWQEVYREDAGHGPGMQCPVAMTDGTASVAFAEIAQTSETVFWYSPDSANWESREIPLPTRRVLVRPLGFVDDDFYIAATNPGTPAQDALWSSADGLSWIEEDVTAVDLVQTGFGIVGYRSVAVDAGILTLEGYGVANPGEEQRTDPLRWQRAPSGSWELVRP